MNFDNPTMASAQQAVAVATQTHLYTPNIDTIDVGYPEIDGVLAKNRLAIRFHVHQKLSGNALEMAVDHHITRPIPSHINGFETDVLEAKYQPQWYSPWAGWWSPAPVQQNIRAQTVSPLEGGISISNEYHNGYGTLGGVVQDKQTGEYMILSNWHVLVGDWLYRPQRRIFQPGRLDGGTGLNTVARLSRDGMSASLDAAVATLVKGQGIINNQIGLGPVTGVSQPVLGLRVKKSGRRTGVTQGQVTGVFGSSTLMYAGVRRQIQRVFTITPEVQTEEVSAAGDSGAWWLNAATNEAVGLHFAGSNVPEQGLAMEMAAVLQTLNVEIV